MKRVILVKLISYLGFLLFLSSDIFALDDMETCKKLYLSVDGVFGAGEDEAQQACETNNVECIAWWINWTEKRNENIDNVIYRYAFKKGQCKRVSMACIKERSMEENYKDFTGSLILASCGASITQ